MADDSEGTLPDGVVPSKLEKAVGRVFGPGTFEHLDRSLPRVFLRGPIKTPDDLAIQGPRLGSAESEPLREADLVKWKEAHRRREKQRRADLEFLAEGLARHGWRFWPEGKIQLRKRAVANDRPALEEKVELAREGLHRAAQRLIEYQHVKLPTTPTLPGERRREWAVDEENRPIVPRKLPPHIPGTIRGHNSHRPGTEVLFTPDQSLVKNKSDLPDFEILFVPDQSRTVVEKNNHYVQDNSGVKVPIVPDQLHPRTKLLWFQNAAIAVAVEELMRWPASTKIEDDPDVGRRYATEYSMALEDQAEAFGLDDEEGLAAMVAEEVLLSSALHDIQVAASRQQWEIWLAFLDPDCGSVVEFALDRPVSEDERNLLSAACSTSADVAEALGKPRADASQVRGQLMRLRRKLGT